MNGCVITEFLGAYIKNYQDKSGLTIKAKVFNVAFLWIMIMSSAYFFTEELFIKLLLLAIAIGVTIHLTNGQNSRDLRKF